MNDPIALGHHDLSLSTDPHSATTIRDIQFEDSFTDHNSRWGIMVGNMNAMKGTDSDYWMGENGVGFKIRFATSATSGPLRSLSALALIQAGSLINASQALSR